KTRGLVSKRRSIVKISDLERLTDPQPDCHWIGYWYAQRLLARRLRPLCQIAYHRTARVAMTSYGPIRLTLDEDIRALALGGLDFNNVERGTLLLEDQVILELKYRFDMPLLFKLLVEEFALEPQPLSKYRLAVGALGFVKSPSIDFPADGHLGPPACLNS